MFRRIKVFGFAFILFCCLFSGTKAQTDSLYYFKGRVIDSLDSQPVAFTHIINLSRHTAVICDTLGYFYIKVRLEDTLLFSAIGYMPYVLEVEERDLDIIRDIQLKEAYYPIKGVNINPLGSYESFKRKLINLELPKTGYEINESLIFDIEQGIDTLDMVKYPVMSPVTALYNWLSKEGKSRRKLLSIMEQEQFEREIEYKYSPALVSEITGYSGFKLYDFMDFCSFKKEFLQESSQYEIRVEVLKKKKIFEARQEN